jgi:hypothetical protein
MRTRSMSRRTVLATLLGAASLPAAAFAAAPKRYRCRARLEREPDHKETRTVEVVCEDGKTVNGIDGDRDYKTSPPTVMGLSCDFTAKADAGEAIAVRVHAVYRTTQVTIVGGLTVVTATTDVVAALLPADVSTSTLDVNGTPYALTISVKPIA